MVSVDIAPECLELARARAATAGLRCEIREQAFGQVRDGPYAAVLSLYDRSVCGFPSEAEDARSLRHLGGLLEPGGWLVFGINDWPAGLPEAWRRAGKRRAEGVELVEVVPDPADDDVHAPGHPGAARRPAGTARAHSAALLAARAQAAARGGKRIRPLAALHRLAEERPYAEGGEGCSSTRGAPESPASRIPRESRQRRWAGAARSGRIPGVRARAISRARARGGRAARPGYGISGRPAPRG